MNNSFVEKMSRLAAELLAQFDDSVKLGRIIEENLRGVGYGG